MNPITHFLIGGIVANSANLNRRERTMVTVAAVIPDVDGLGIVVDLITKDTRYPTELWGNYHHILCHNLPFCLVIMAATLLLTKRRLLTPLLVFVSFHLHLLGDIVGARGPEGEQWPIDYLWPFSNSLSLVWSGQWGLNAWPNFVITILALVVIFYFGWKKGRSPLEIFSNRADDTFVAALRKRFGEPRL
jgi:LexA-binding, inner membrane-associated putative hydrolase